MSLNFHLTIPCNMIKIKENSTKSKASKARAGAGSLTTVTGLTPYSGAFGFEEAAHLLRRTTMGVNKSQIEDAVSSGLTATVDLLLSSSSSLPEPINYDDEGDPNLPIGAPWFHVPYNADGTGKGDRKRSLYAWNMYQLLRANVSIRERMTIFWHNHFSVEKVKVSDPKYLYKYNNLLRTNALGNFRDLVKRITIDNAMLYYLDGRVNTVNNPNENYAREVLELFTIGKGPIIGDGDYSNYTEQDVLALAKVFTGWKDYGRFSSTIGTIYTEFNPSKHDTSDKQLSYHFDNAVISDGGDQEYLTAIDIIFQQDEVAYFICRKLYRYFVNFDTDPVEGTVIEAMAQCLLQNDFNIAPVLNDLFKSEHFYEMAYRGCIIKNPMEFVSNIMLNFNVPIPQAPLEWYPVFNSFNGKMDDMGMQYYAPPSVAGWPAYYLEPQFSELWINSVTLRPRTEFSSKVAQNGQNLSGFKFKIDVLSFAASLSNPYDPNALIEEIASIIYPEELVEAQITFLKDILIPGLPDFEWTVEYQNYLSDPTNMGLADGVTDRLRNLIEAMLAMPEFYLM